MDPIVYTIAEFQRAHRLGHSKFYTLKKEGLAPRVVEIGGKKVIYGEEAAAWRRRMAELSEAKSVNQQRRGTPDSHAKGTPL